MKGMTKRNRRSFDGEAGNLIQQEFHGLGVTANDQEKYI